MIDSSSVLNPIISKVTTFPSVTSYPRSRISLQVQVKMFQSQGLLPSDSWLSGHKCTYSTDLRCRILSRPYPNYESFIITYVPIYLFTYLLHYEDPHFGPIS